MAKKKHDIAELVNVIQWSVAILNKTLPPLPEPQHGFSWASSDRIALRKTAFAILVREQLTGRYEASPEALSGLIPHIPDQ